MFGILIVFSQTKSKHCVNKLCVFKVARLVTYWLSCWLSVGTYNLLLMKKIIVWNDVQENYLWLISDTRVSLIIKYDQIGIVLSRLNLTSAIILIPSDIIISLCTVHAYTYAYYIFISFFARERMMKRRRKNGWSWDVFPFAEQIITAGADWNGHFRENCSYFSFSLFGPHFSRCRNIKWYKIARVGSEGTTAMLLQLTLYKGISSRYRRLNCHKFSSLQVVCAAVLLHY